MDAQLFLPLRLFVPHVPSPLSPTGFCYVVLSRYTCSLYRFDTETFAALICLHSGRDMPIKICIKAQSRLLRIIMELGDASGHTLLTRTLIVSLLWACVRFRYCPALVSAFRTIASFAPPHEH